jgi:hypothetical protein
VDCCELRAFFCEEASGVSARPVVTSPSAFIVVPFPDKIHYTSICQDYFDNLLLRSTCVIPCILVNVHVARSIALYSVPAHQLK